MIGLLMALHPRRWRDMYGDEYRALLEQTRLTPSVIFDVLRNTAALHARARILLAVVVVGAVITIGIELFAVREHITDNILWAPTNPLRTAILAAVLAPSVVVAVRIARRRRARPPASAALR